MEPWGAAWLVPIQRPCSGWRPQLGTPCTARIQPPPHPAGLRPPWPGFSQPRDIWRTWGAMTAVRHLNSESAGLPHLSASRAACYHPPIQVPRPQESSPPRFATLRLCGRRGPRLALGAKAPRFHPESTAASCLFHPREMTRSVDTEQWHQAVPSSPGSRAHPRAGGILQKGVAGERRGSTGVGSGGLWGGGAGSPVWLEGLGQWRVGVRVDRRCWERDVPLKSSDRLLRRVASGCGGLGVGQPQ